MPGKGRQSSRLRGRKVKGAGTNGREGDRRGEDKVWKGMCMW